MKLFHVLACTGLWLVAAEALAGEPAAKGDTTPRATRYLVITQDRVPLQFEENQIGELNEGLRVELRDTAGDWCRVRASFGQNWFEGWIRKAMTAPDSLLDVPIKVAPARLTDIYRDPVDSRRDHILPGQQFLEVRVKFEPGDKSPAKVFFNWADERNADLYIRYGREAKAVPYGFIRQVQGMTRPVFERDEKRQAILLTPGAKDLIETYVFAVPARARDFDLVLKDVANRVTIKR
ncbi:MAG: hypothetical protein FJ291_08840 [Planctomycetes bacterium]|nr:hypothetical protein [Planctomycetota bacterium]